LSVEQVILDVDPYHEPLRISLRVQNVIGDEEFSQQRKKLEVAQLRLGQKLEEARHAASQFELLETLILFRSKAIEWFRVGDDDIKRLIFRTAGFELGIARQNHQY
jgi:hypothetical protein